MTWETEARNWIAWAREPGHDQLSPTMLAAARKADPDGQYERTCRYRAPHPYSDSIERDGLRMTFRSFRYSLEGYRRAIRDAGGIVEELREIYDDLHPVWRELPLFLRMDVRKQA